MSTALFPEPDNKPEKMAENRLSCLSGRACSLANLKPPWNSQTARLAALRPRKLTASSLRQRKMASLSSRMAKERDATKQSALIIKYELIAASGDRERLKFVGLELLSAIGSLPLHSLEDKKSLLNAICEFHKAFTSK